MKLSTAIRAGIKLSPIQITGTYISDVDGVVGSCALGCAYIGLTGSTETPVVASPTVNRAVSDAIEQNLGDNYADRRAALALAAYDRAVTSGYHAVEAEDWLLLGSSPEATIVLLNDTLRMSREEIADLLDEHGF